ncbi:MAG: hypothetical protein ABJZ55_07460 [Fuerstiella sp.]
MNTTTNINGTLIKNIAVAAFAVMTVAAFTAEDAAAQCRNGGGNPGYGYGQDDYGYGNRYNGRLGNNSGRYTSRNTNSRSYNNYDRSYGQTGYRGVSSQSPLLSFGLSLTGNRNSQYSDRSYNSSNRSGFGNPFYSNTRRSGSYQPSNRFDSRYSPSPFSRVGL